MCDQQRLRPACAYAQTDQSICLSLEYSMTVKLLTEHFLEFLSLKGCCTGSSESTLVKMSNCWKSHVTAQLSFDCLCHFVVMRWVVLRFVISAYSSYTFSSVIQKEIGEDMMRALKDVNGLDFRTGTPPDLLCKYTLSVYLLRYLL